MKKTAPEGTFGAWLADRMAEKKLTQNQLADSSGLTLAKVHRALHNDLTEATQRKLEAWFRQSFVPGKPFVSSEELGSYTGEEMTFICGSFVGYRWGYEFQDEIARSVLFIDWNQAGTAIECLEHNSFVGSAPAKAIKSTLYRSKTTGLAALLTTHKGAVRTMKFMVPPQYHSSEPAKPFRLYGSVDSQADPDGDFDYHIANSPFVLLATEKAISASAIPQLISALGPTDDEFTRARRWLERAKKRCYSAWGI